MNSEALILQETSALVQKDFDLDYIPNDVTEAEILDFLQRFIQDLLDNDMKKLFYVLYRLDIDENKVHAALSPTSIEPPHEQLAALIFEREKQKATTRIMYNSDEVDEDVSPW